MDMTNAKKVLVPVDKGNDKKFWFKIGIARLNRDGSTNIYLDALPATTTLQIRDFDERDLAWQTRREAERNGTTPASVPAGDLPF